jgi:hypothetical protein
MINPLTLRFADRVNASDSRTRARKKKKVNSRQGNIIATSKRVRRTANNRIWCMQYENLKTPNVFHGVMFDEDLDCFVCDCLASRI